MLWRMKKEAISRDRGGVPTEQGLEGRREMEQEAEGLPRAALGRACRAACVPSEAVVTVK